MTQVAHTLDAGSRLPAVALLAALLGAAGCGPRGAPVEVEELAGPLVAPGSVSLGVAAGPGGEVAVSWLEPRSDRGYRFRFSRRSGTGWTAPVTIVSDSTLTAHPTDLPGVVFLADGALLAHWQESADWSPMPYETDVRIAVSRDGGASFGAAGRPYAMPTTGEHAFVSTWAAEAGAGIAWLDGRRQRYEAPADSRGEGRYHGSMALHSASLSATGAVGAEVTVDSVTCECCPTAAALTSRGPVIAYRNRELPADVAATGIEYAQDVVRDVAVTRRDSAGWTAPTVVHADGWVYNGCPNNGPAIAARGEDVVVAWMTGAGGRPAVYAAFSADAGDSFGEPVRVDDGEGLGQVTVALVGSPARREAVVGWLEGGSVRTRRIGADGRAGPSRALGRTAGRARLPSWVPDGDGVLAAWLQADSGGTSVRLTRLR